MKKTLSLVLMLLCLLQTVFFSGCSKSYEKFTDYSFDYFDTATTVIGFEKTKQDFEKNCTMIKSWLEEYHKLYDIYTLYDGITNLCVLNKSQGKELAVDKKIIDLLLYAKQLYSKTDKTNIALGSVLSVWHNCREQGMSDPSKAELPPNDILTNAAGHIDFENVIIDSKNNTVKITDKSLKLDVGAIAKGFAAQEVSEKMLENGIEGYLLNLGGNVKTVGKRKDGEKWKVGIENPDTDSKEAYIQKLELEDMSLVTSGSYQRFYTVNGKNYHHIIDPKTLYPADYFLSVSVLCEDSALADGLSTALFCLPYEDGKKLVEGIDGVYAMWVTKEKEQLYSKGFKNFCYD